MHLMTLPMLGQIFGGWEIILILAVILLLLGSKKLPELARGLGQGIDEFKKATREVSDELSHDAGKSVGGIFGKQAAQALTTDNEVAELYDATAFDDDANSHRRARTSLVRKYILFRRLFRKVTKFFTRLFMT